MEEIRIKKSNFKLILFLLSGIVFAILFINMFLNPNNYTSYLFRYALLIKIFGVVGFFFTFLSVIFIIIKNFKNSFGLAVNEKGIIDNSSVASVGLIEWKDIKGIRENNVMSTSFLLIDVYDNKKYIEKPKNIFISMLLKINLKTYGTPISISNKSLKCDFNELRSLINEQYKLHFSTNH